jgi:hypothetical protein
MLTCYLSYNHSVLQDHQQSLMLLHKLRGHEQIVQDGEICSGWVQNVRFSRDGRQIATCETGKVCIHDAKTGNLQHKLDSQGEGRLYADFTTEGMLFGRGKGANDASGSVIWKVQTSPQQQVISRFL